MSTNRENVVWQSADGTWNRGFFAYEQIGEDYEWDVEYDFSTFFWVSTGHASEQSAIDSWHGSNPGGWNTTSYTSNREKAESYDAMAKQLRNAV